MACSWRFPFAAVAILVASSVFSVAGLQGFAAPGDADVRRRLDMEKPGIPPEGTILAAMSADIDHHQPAEAKEAGSPAPADTSQVVVNGLSGAKARLASGKVAFLWVTDTTMYIIGTILVFLAVPGLWFFERQLARVDCLLTTAQGVCTSLTGEEADPANFGQLVHLTGETPRPLGPVEDPRFNTEALGTNCLRLRSDVQVFQWVERPAGTTPDSKDASSPETRRPSQISGAVSYTQIWTEVEHNHQRFRDKTKENTKPARLPLGRDTTSAKKVVYGAFLLPPGLVDQLQSFRSAGKFLGSEVTTRDGLHTFKRHTDDYFYFRPGGGRWTAEDVAKAPQVGDARARFECVVPAAATVLALQAETDTDAAAATLLPYRLVSQGLLCGGSSQSDRVALVAEGRKSREQLAKENQCFPGSRICCGCNLVAACCAGAMTPEVFRCFEGTKTVDQCFLEISVLSASSISLRTWSARAIGSLALFLGLMMGYSQVVWHRPFSALPVIELLGNFARPGACIIATFAMSALMISLAYLSFRPFTALLWFLVATGTCVVPNVTTLPPGIGGASLVQLSGPLPIVNLPEPRQSSAATKRRAGYQSSRGTRPL